MIISAFLKNPSKTSYDGEDHDEHIKYVLRASWLLQVPWLFAVLVLIISSIIVIPFLANLEIKGENVFNAMHLMLITAFWYTGTFGFFLQKFINWFFNVLIITNKKIVDVDFYGILYKNISETTLDNIEDVTSTVSGAIGVIFNIGNMFIQTAGEKREFEFDGLDNPSKIRDLLADLVAERKHH